MIEDELLKLRFKFGGEDALRRIYEKYLDTMLSVAMAFLNDSHAAQDIVHDVFVSCGNHPSGPGYFLMTPSTNGKPRYERVNFAFNLEGFIDRVNLTPSETKLCCEFQKGFGPYRYPGRTLYIADFDVASRTVSNPKPITDTEPNPETIRLYPRWTRDQSAVVYHGNETGKNQLYMYRLKDGSTIRVLTNENADYMFPCGEETPK